MPQLADLQAEFLHAVVSGDTSALLPFLAESALPPGEAFRIHENNTRILLTECLSATFPVVRKLVGDEFFDALAQQFIKDCLPSSGALIHYGAEFSGFLADFPPARSLCYLSDVARLEWAWHECLNAADAEPLNAAELADIDQHEMIHLRFRLDPGLRLISSPYPVDAIWRANMADGPEIVDLDAGSACIMLTREGFEVRMRNLSPGAAQFVAALGRGETLAQAAEEAFASQADFDFPSTFADMITSRILTSFELTR